MIFIIKKNFFFLLEGSPSVEMITAALFPGLLKNLS